MQVKFLLEELSHPALFIHTVNAAKVSLRVLLTVFSSSGPTPIIGGNFVAVPIPERQVLMATIRQILLGNLLSTRWLQIWI